MRRDAVGRGGQWAFTLVELMVAVAVLALLLGVALPSFSRMLDDYRLTTFSNELHHALSLARSEAIKRGRRITLCPSRDGQWCDNAAGWDAGWVVFADANGNARRDPSELLVAVGPAAPQGMIARGNGSMARYVSFIPLGITQAAGGAFQAGTIQVCNGERQRSLVISRSGRVRVQRGGVCTLA